MNEKSFYVITIHNKESLLQQVLEGIEKSHGRGEGEIIAVLDGCTDRSEEIVDKFQSSLKLTKLYSADTHEIISLNRALTYIRTDCYPSDNDMVFTMQDDVILKEPNINEIMKDVYDQQDNLGYVSMRLGVSVAMAGDTFNEFNYVESEFGHWDQLGWKNHTSIKHHTMIETQIAIRSPTCTQWKRFADHGVFDAAMAPCGFDCHDFSIRMNKAGFVNLVIGLEFESDVHKGTMRENPNSNYNKKMSEIYERNKRYLVKKHFDYFKAINNE